MTDRVIKIDQVGIQAGTDKAVSQYDWQELQKMLKDYCKLFKTPRVGFAGRLS